MAGNYPDPSTWRMSYDKDGTAGLIVFPSGQVVDMTTGQLQAMNNEASDSTLIGTGSTGQYDQYCCLIFPEKRDIDYIFLKARYSLTSIETSVNTTNGIDGTWVTYSGGLPNISTALNLWRTGGTASTVLAVKAIRFRLGGSAPWTPDIEALHIWGEIAPAEQKDRLVFWNVTSDTKMSPATLDFGDVPRSSSADKVVRVKNISPTKQANNIRVSFDILTDASSGPSVPAQHTLSYSGGAFIAQVNIGALGPGAISGPITIRRVTPSNAQYGQFAPRVNAIADSWT